MRYAFVPALLLSAATLLAADPIEMSVRPVWTALSPAKHRYPYLVRIRNNTASDAVGRIAIESASTPTYIPVEVGRRSEKEVPVFALLDGVGLAMSFDSNIGSKRIQVPTLEEYAVFRIGLIGDTEGDLAFLRMRRTESGSLLNDSSLSAGYCEPEDAPERAAGYFPLDAVFLGEGSERLGERQIEALKQYVVQGGRLIMPGGANAPHLSIAAWSSVLPVREAMPKTFPKGTTFVLTNRFGKVTITEPLTLMLGKPVHPHLIATEGTAGPVSVVRPVGLGSVVYLGYNPFDEPILSHPNRRQLVLDGMKVAMYGSRSTLVHEAALMSDEYNRYGYRYGAPREINEVRGLDSLYSHTQTTGSESLSNTPFDIQLIPSATVGWVFLGFFLTVIPLNFLVLRIFKKMELAWLTAPIISIAFAGILLNYSKGLYGAKLSRAYKGFVVQDLDTGLSAQWLRASFFIPQGGTYDLTLENTDQTVSASHFDGSEYMSYSRFQEQQTGVPVVDAGMAKLPQVDVPNLAFRELTYHRVNTSPLPIEIKLQNRGSRLLGTVKNNSPYSLTRVALVQKDRTYVLPDLPKGGSFKLTSETSFMPSAKSKMSSGRSEDQAVFFAVMSNFDPGGPGTVEPKSTKVVLVCTKSLERAP